VVLTAQVFEFYLQLLYCVAAILIVCLRYKSFSFGGSVKWNTLYTLKMLCTKSGPFHVVFDFAVSQCIMFMLFSLLLTLKSFFALQTSGGNLSNSDMQLLPNDQTLAHTNEALVVGDHCT